jgi:hypothetical protein
MTQGKACRWGHAGDFPRTAFAGPPIRVLDPSVECYRVSTNGLSEWD